MAFKITAKTRSLLNQISKNPSVLLDIEGVDFVFSSSVVFERIKWDDGNFWDSGLRWDGQVKKEDALSLINLRESTRAITQQIYPDKDGASSITSATITIVDKNSAPAKLFALDNTQEMIGKKCTLNFGFVGANYPEDFLPIMNAIITEFSYKSGAIKLQLSHADTLRRQAILPEFSTQLSASIDSSVTTIPVNETSKLLSSQDALKTFIKIDDEIMKVVTINANDFTVIRGELGTLQAVHDNDADITSIYQITGNPLTLAQKIMQSGGQEFFDSDINIKEFINNTVVFESFDIEQETGLIENDIIQIDTYGDFTVDTFGKLETGNSFIRVKESLSDVSEVNQAWRFKSQYNTLNFGLGMFTFEVDNAEFEYIKNIFSPNFTDFTFEFSSGISNARDFINKELLFVAGCYGVPRNARSSVKFLSPPLTIEELPVLDATTITNTKDLMPTRSVNRFYYNDILYAFNKSVRDGEFKSFSQFINQDAVNRFGVGNKQLRVESTGLKRNSETDLIINRLASRFLDRYKLAATYIKGLKLPLKYGFNLSVGDVVLFGGENTKLLNIDTGARDYPIEKMEIINLSVDLSGEVMVDLLSTGFAVDGNFGVFSPSSLVATGSTTTKLVLKKINNLDEVDIERQKWESLVGAKLRVRSADYTFDENVDFLSLDQQDNRAINISALSLAPGVDYIVELANYEFQDRKVRLKYTFTMNQDEFINSTDIANPFEFFIGQKVAVHSDDFARDEFETTITNIVGSTITFESLGFTPQAGDKIEARSFVDFDGYLFL